MMNIKAEYNDRDSEKIKYGDILFNDEQLGPYPTQLLKYVKKPTNKIVGPVKRRDPREHVFSRSMRGDFGEKIQKRFMGSSVKHPIGAAMFDLQMHINAIREHRNKMASHKAPIPEDPRVLSRHFKSLGYFLGADIVGIGKLPQSAVYTHDAMTGMPIEAAYKYAIALVARKPENAIRPSNGWDHIAVPASFQAYQRAALYSEAVANYIRRLGYEAEASNMFNYITLMPQILLEAGIGEVCRLGIILNPFIGTNFKASCVLTNLDLEIDSPVDFGLQDYCKNCKICAEQCPSGAISHKEQILYNGYYTWKVNAKACSNFGVLNEEGGVCGRCPKVCPWHRPNTEPHNFVDWDGDLSKLYEGVNEQRERLIKNNYVEPAELTGKWWFELEEVDGHLVIPTGSNRHKICRDYPL